VLEGEIGWMDLRFLCWRTRDGFGILEFGCSWMGFRVVVCYV
jgi:hypothetical protein